MGLTANVLEISPLTTVSSKYSRVLAATEIICCKGQDALATVLAMKSREVGRDVRRVG